MKKVKTLLAVIIVLSPMVILIFDLHISPWSRFALFEDGSFSIGKLIGCVPFMLCW